MKISKWIDMGQEVEVEIGTDDIRIALAEAFAVVTEDRLGEEGPTRFDIMRALNAIGAFLNAMTDEQIALLNDAVRRNVHVYLATVAERFRSFGPDLDPQPPQATEGPKGKEELR